MNYKYITIKVKTFRDDYHGKSLHEIRDSVSDLFDIPIDNVTVDEKN